MLNPFKMITHVKLRLKQFKKQADESLQANAEFLDSGVWHVNESMTSFYKKGYKKKCSAEASHLTLFILKNNLTDRSTRLARKIFKATYRYKVVDDKKTFNGKVFLKSTTGRINRFIDYDEKQILLKYKHIIAMQKDVKQKQTWGEFFTTVPFRKIDYDNLFAIEDYIERKDCPTDKKFNLILQDYIEFSKKQTSAVTEKHLLSEEEKSAIRAHFIKYERPTDGEMVIDYLDKNGYVQTLSHGDMSPLNALFDGEKIYYIDFENLNKRSIFYDLFQYLDWCKTYKNELLINDYLEGKFDKEFTEISENYGLKFDKNCRKIYMDIYKTENRFLWTIRSKK